MKVSDRLYAVALERDLRKSTVIEYKRCLRRVGVLDLDDAAVSLETVTEALWSITNPNTRRNTAIALRAVLGLPIRIPKPVSRRYDLPDEDTLRLALMTTPHEVRGLLMMYGGLRLGEACAITRADVSGDRLNVDKQIQALRETGKPTVIHTTRTKGAEASIVIPAWLATRLHDVTETAKPDNVRESLRRAGSRVGISLNPHQLRHWYATTAIERGVPVMVVSKQLRHSDVATTLRVYTQHDPGKHIREAFGERF